jgi:tetratricopeptide (TPR) repeat protein
VRHGAARIGALPYPLPHMSTLLNTQDATRLWQDAERQLDAGLQDAAAQSYRRLLDDPDLAAAANLRLSLIASNQGHHREAVDTALAACAARLPEPELLQAIAKRLVHLCEEHAALACALDPAVLRGPNIGVQAELGKVLANNYLPVAALQLLEQARAGGFRNPTLDYLVGLCRMYAGDEAGAVQSLETAVAAVPDLVPALRALTRLSAGDGDARIARLQASLARLGESAEQAPMLLYSLFAEHDRRDEIPQAWDALERAMQLRRRQVRYDPAAEQQLFDFLQGIRPAPAEGRLDDGPRPVFIVGMPRSGTSLIERLLGQHSDIAGAGELHDFTRQLRWCCDLAGAPYLDLPLAQRAEAIDFAELGRRYLERTRWRARGRAVYTDKMPANFINVSHIVRALPQARILHMVRGPMDTCFSNLKEWFAGIYPHSYDQQEMADHFRRYRTLMAHWRALYPERILDVRYDELVTDPERVLREVLAFCGLPWQRGLSTASGRGGTVATASTMQVREPVHARFLNQWRRYEAHLGPLKDRLGALAY